MSKLFKNKSSNENKESLNTNNEVAGLNLKSNIIGIVLFILACGVITFLLWPHISKLIDSPALFLKIVDDNYFLSILLYLSLQITQVVVAIIPGEFLEIAAGLAFGWFGGLLIAQLGVALGTIIVFIVFRKLGKPIILRIVKDNNIGKLSKLNNNPKRDAVIFMIFLIPGLPKDLLTYAAAFFDISISRFLVLTLIARIPSVLTSTIAGQSIVNGNYLSAIIIFAVTGVIAVVGFIFSEKIMNFISKKEINK